MRILILSWLWLCCLTLSAQQKSEQIHNDNLIEAYYSKTVNRPIYIYKSINGPIVDTLRNVDSKYSWYKIAIIDSEYLWFKIKNIQRLPDQYKNFNYENHWVKASNFLVSICTNDPTRSIYLYDEPTESSNKIHKIDSFQVAEIIETSNLWALIRFTIGNKSVSGWLSFKNQYALPWTTCIEY